MTGTHLIRQGMGQDGPPGAFTGTTIGTTANTSVTPFTA